MLQDNKAKSDLMAAVGFYKSLAISEERSLVDIKIAKPVINNSYDLLVKVEAVAVNPADYKVRKNAYITESKDPRILGWDVAGIVVGVGSKSYPFKTGDRVFYAGDITRQGANSEYHLVDSRIVGHVPECLSFAEAASLPLTSITAWESLFQQLNVTKDSAQKSILIINGADGVGSIAIQLAKTLTKLNIIATASREESVAWCTNIGAHHVVDHTQNLVEQVRLLGYKYVDYILILNDTDGHIEACAELIVPFGKICNIVESKDGMLNVGLLKTKSAVLAQEFMFTRSMYQTADMHEQQNILNSTGKLVSDGKIKHTVKTVLSPINALNLKKAHQQLENGHVIAKIVLTGFSNNTIYG